MVRLDSPGVAGTHGTLSIMRRAWSETSRNAPRKYKVARFPLLVGGFLACYECETEGGDG
jgi:hypothetical protein